MARLISAFFSFDMRFVPSSMSEGKSLPFLIRMRMRLRPETPNTSDIADAPEKQDALARIFFAGQGETECACWRHANEVPTKHCNKNTARASCFLGALAIRK